MADTQRRSDDGLKQAVVAELDRLDTVDSTRIGVSVVDGAVTLSGEVESYPEKEIAEQTTLGVQGVTAVAEGITVRSSFGGTNDTDIARTVSETLERSVDITGGHVSATVHDSTVTLFGRLPADHQREAAVLAVTGLKGVRAVRDEITVSPSPKPSPRPSPPPSR